MPIAIAVYCALRTDTLAEGMVLAVNHDGDSDSTGAIAGNLLGAAHGTAAIPSSWLQPLELAEVIGQIADDLHDARTWRHDDCGERGRSAIARYPGT